jgi:hypothetical protein
MARIEKENGNIKAAKTYLRKIRKNSSRSHAANKQAREMLNALKKKDGN